MALEEFPQGEFRLIIDQSGTVQTQKSTFQQWCGGFKFHRIHRQTGPFTTASPLAALLNHNEPWR